MSSLKVFRVELDDHHTLKLIRSKGAFSGEVPFYDFTVARLQDMEQKVLVYLEDKLDLVEAVDIRYCVEEVEVDGECRGIPITVPALFIRIAVGEEKEKDGEELSESAR